MYFEDVNIELLDNVDQRLKEPLRQVLTCMKEAKEIYSKEIIKNLLRCLAWKN